MFRFLLFFFLLFSSLYGYDKIYFMPEDSQKAKNKIVKLLENATKSIDIAMYNFTYKKFNKAINKAIENGVDVTLIYSKSKIKFNKKIKLIKPKRKQHIKLVIIDDKIAIYGSANWKKESFGKNYEILNITDDKKRVKIFAKIFSKIE